MDATAGNEAQAEAKDDGFEWCCVEIFGHRSHAGRAREEERFGLKMLRIDELTINYEDGTDKWETLYYAGSSVFSYRPATEEFVRKVAGRFYPPSPTKQLSFEAPNDGQIKQRDLMTDDTFDRGEDDERPF